MTVFHLEILSPERTFYHGDCISLVVPISDGMLGIQANHTPLTAAISDGEAVFILPDGTKRVCAVASGMVDVSENDARILCESVCAPEEVDVERERRALQDAQLALSEHMAYKDYVLTQLAFAQAFNKLRVKKHADGGSADVQNNAM